MYLLFILLILVLGVSLAFGIKFQILPLKLRYPSLFILILVTIAITLNNNPTFAEVGLSNPEPKQILIYGLGTLFIYLLMIWLKPYHNQIRTQPLLKNEKTAKNILLYSLLSVPAQEFLFRSFLYFSLQQLNWLNPVSMTLSSGFFFMIGHIFTLDIVFLISILASGLVWGCLYYFMPNLFLVSISHVIVGLLAYQQGLINQNTFRRSKPHKSVAKNLTT